MWKGVPSPNFRPERPVSVGMIGAGWVEVGRRWSYQVIRQGWGGRRGDGTPWGDLPAPPRTVLVLMRWVGVWVLEAGMEKDGAPGSDPNTDGMDELMVLV